MCGIKHCGKSTQAKLLAAAIGAAIYDTDDIILQRTGMDARTLYKSQGKDAFMQAELEACQYLRDILNGEQSQAQNARAASTAHNFSQAQNARAASTAHNFSQAKDAGGDKNPLQAQKAAAVIATGGGICQNAPAMDILKTLGSVVYLEIDEKSAADRIIREARFLPDGTIQNLPAYIADKNPADESQARAIFHDFYVERTKKYRSLADVTVQMQGSRQENRDKILSALCG